MSKYKVEHSRRARFRDILINDGLAGITAENISITEVRYLIEDFRQEMKEIDDRIPGLVAANKGIEYPEEFKNSPSNYWRNSLNEGHYFKLEQCVKLLEQFHSHLKGVPGNLGLMSSDRNQWRPQIINIELDKLKTDAINSTMDWFHRFHPGEIDSKRMWTQLSNADFSLMKEIYDLERDINDGRRKDVVTYCINQESNLKEAIIKVEANKGHGIENDGIQFSAELHSEIEYHRQFYKKCVNLLSISDVDTPFQRSDNRTSKLIIDEFNRESSDGWKSLFKTKSDFDTLVELLTNYFEQTLDEIPAIIIRTKINAKTALARALGRIHDDLSDEKLTGDEGFLRIVRLVDKFSDEKLEPNSKIIKAMQRK